MMYHTVSYMCTHISYRTCTCCKYLPEDKPSGLKHVKKKLKQNLTELNFLGLRNKIIEYSVQI